MGIVPIAAMYGFAIGTLVFWTALASIFGVVWLTRKVIKSLNRGA